MILFSTESRIEPWYLTENNLYSSSDLNKDVTTKGYIDKSGRVKAIKLRGASSNGILMPTSSLKGADKLKVGTEFNLINGELLVEKYEKPSAQQGKQNKVKGQTKRYERIDGKNFPEHFSTDNYFRNEFSYSPEDYITVTQKLHGTSVRLGYVKTKVKPSKIDKLFRKEQKYEYDYIAGSRRVIKDLKSDKEFNHYYHVDAGSKDLYNRALDEMKDKLPKNTIIYAEIVGYNEGGIIQKGYDYGCQPNRFKIYVYRVTTINEDGYQVDYSWDALKEFCNERGIMYTPELWSGYKRDFNVEDFLNINYSLDIDILFNEKPVAHTAEVDEGVCIRREGIRPYVTKAKCSKFLEHETKILDEGVDIIS